jgi:hypothetical protein
MIKTIPSATKVQTEVVTERAKTERLKRSTGKQRQAQRRLPAHQHVAGHDRAHQLQHDQRDGRDPHRCTDATALSTALTTSKQCGEGGV